MFERNVDYPKAVVSDVGDGMGEAIRWCVQQMNEGDTFTVWTSQQSSLRDSAQLRELVSRYSSVAHAVGRGGGGVRGHGPVLMAWPDMNDIGEVLRRANNIRALCVVAGLEDEIRPWVTFAEATVLGDATEWATPTPDLHPLLVEEMEGLTQRISHSNTMDTFNKGHVLSALYMLQSAGIPMDSQAMQGWALAHGWSGENPKHLAKYVADVNAGKHLRYRNMMNEKYATEFRRRAATHR